MLIKKIIKKSVLRIIFSAFSLINFVYWHIVKIVMNIWGRRGLHLISIGEFISGPSKKRSIYREEMLLRAIPLFVNFRDKSCLDIACNDGFWSFRFGRFGIKNLIGVDAGEGEIARANFLKAVYGFPSFQFKKVDIFHFLYNENKEKYDIVFLLSILYHLPEQMDYEKLFKTISRINNECLIIDSRWFDDDDYWYDKTSNRTVINTSEGILRKWRPTRESVFNFLRSSGYEQTVEINPSVFIDEAIKAAAYGDGDPYSVENVSDYISNNRTIIIAYKRKKSLPIIEKQQFVTSM
ncbi:MAG: methyltransferase domain-containing protein [Nitrospirae bacterium]|nr:methyltransferase domain-containing protein [Nitrospirota bacterium]